jgi:hypothetical protein
MPTTLPNGATPAVGARTDPRREYVAGGGYPAAWGPYFQALPRFIDDVTRDFGDDIYERMLFDPQVESSVETLKMAILGGSLSLQPPVDDEHPEWEQAREIADFCEHCLGTLPRPFVSETLYDLLDALPFGNRAAEIVLREAEPGETDAFPTLAGRQPLLLSRVKPKPRRSFAYVVDSQWNVLGLSALRFDAPGMTLSGTISNPSLILPRWKFCILSWGSRNGDPRGTSILRPAYNAWWIKQQIWGEYLKYLTQFGSPSLVGTVAQHATPRGRTDADGNPVLGSDGLQVIDYPEDVLVERLVAYQNGSAIGLPFGTDVKILQATGQGTSVGPFTGAFSVCNAEIEKAITGQSLATNEGEHQARAAASVHQDVLGLPVQHGRSLLEQMVRTDLLCLLVELNFGPEFKRLTPLVSLGDTETQDVAATARAIAALETAGFLHVSQRRPIDAWLGIPVRSQEAAAEEIAAVGQAREQLAESGGTPFGAGDEPDEEDEETP